MKSETDICNLALTWLAANTITSLDDDTTEGRLCKRLYTDTLGAVLEDADWSFAMRRGALTPMVDVPAYGYSVQFLVPTTWLRIVSVSDDGRTENNIDWVLEDGKILCDSQKIYVRYVGNITDPTKFSFLFSHAFAARMAADMAIPLTESRTLMTDMWKLYDAKRGSAGAGDGMQGRSQKIINRDLTGNR